MVGRRSYNLMYRWWAPWDAVGVRGDLIRLLDEEHVTPTTHPRAIDLGCGTGANVVFLASRGFDAVGIDFSRVALSKARNRARAAGLHSRCRFIKADLIAPALPDVDGAFDLLTDFGTLDDLHSGGRTALAGHAARLARPGAVLLLWCFYGARKELPLISFSGPSRLTPGIEPGEVEALFAAAFDIERFSQEHKHVRSFLLRRRASDSAGP